MIDRKSTEQCADEVLTALEQGQIEVMVGSLPGDAPGWDKWRPVIEQTAQQMRHWRPSRDQLLSRTQQQMRQFTDADGAYGSSFDVVARSLEEMCQMDFQHRLLAASVPRTIAADACYLLTVLLPV
jgi:hypothetical protein